MAAEITDGLDYPCGPPPAWGAVHEVAPTVLWSRMPLPVRLNHINIWAIVDTGMLSEEAVQAWSTLLSEGLQGRPVTRVIVTHMHPDHVGMAGWLTRRFGCRLWITLLEHLSCRVIASDISREPPQDALDSYRSAGWSPAALKAYRGRFGGADVGPPSDPHPILPTSPQPTRDQGHTRYPQRSRPLADHRSRAGDQRRPHALLPRRRS